MNFNINAEAQKRRESFLERAKFARDSVVSAFFASSNKRTLRFCVFAFVFKLVFDKKIISR